MAVLFGLNSEMYVTLLPFLSFYLTNFFFFGCVSPSFVMPCVFSCGAGLAVLLHMDASSPATDWTHIPCVGRQIFNPWPPEKSLISFSHAKFFGYKGIAHVEDVKTVTHSQQLLNFHAYFSVFICTDFKSWDILCV